MAIQSTAIQNKTKKTAGEGSTQAASVSPGVGAVLLPAACHGVHSPRPSPSARMAYALAYCASRLMACVLSDTACTRTGGREGHDTHGQAVKGAQPRAAGGGPCTANRGGICRRLGPRVREAAAAIQGQPPPCRGQLRVRVRFEEYLGPCLVPTGAAVL